MITQAIMVLAKVYQATLTGIVMTTLATLTLTKMLVTKWCFLDSCLLLTGIQALNQEMMRHGPLSAIVNKLMRD
jgi:hypothetical protein